MTVMLTFLFSLSTTFSHINIVRIATSHRLHVPGTRWDARTPYVDASIDDPQPDILTVQGVPTSTFVDLTVYDVTGRQVEQLVHGYQQQGMHLVVWDGEGFSSRLYLYKLETDQMSTTRRMLVLK